MLIEENLVVRTIFTLDWILTSWIRRTRKKYCPRMVPQWTWITISRGASNFLLKFFGRKADNNYRKLNVNFDFYNFTNDLWTYKFRSLSSIINSPGQVFTPWPPDIPVNFLVIQMFKRECQHSSIKRSHVNWNRNMMWNLVRALCT